MPSVLLVCGSLRAGSVNAAALATARAVAPVGVTTTAEGQLAALPAFNPDDDVSPLPPPVAALRTSIDASDALLFSVPEYAGALPGALKNLLDWTVGGTEIVGKPAGWVNVSERGATGAHSELATVLTYTGATIVKTACVEVPVPRTAIGPDGLVTPPELRARIAVAMRALERHVGEVVISG